MTNSALPVSILRACAEFDLTPARTRLIKMAAMKGEEYFPEIMVHNITFYKYECFIVFVPFANVYLCTGLMKIVAGL